MQIHLNATPQKIAIALAALLLRFRSVVFSYHYRTQPGAIFFPSQRRNGVEIFNFFWLCLIPVCSPWTKIVKSKPAKKTL